MNIELYENALNKDWETSLVLFKKLKNKNIYSCLNTMFDLAKKELSASAQENLQKVLQAIAPTFPEDHLEKIYENGSATDAFNVFEMFVDGGYHASWQWGSEDLLLACCLSGSPKYLPKFFVRQNLTQKDVPLLIFSRFNQNSDVFGTLLSSFDLQETFDSIDQLYNNGNTVSIEWRQFRQWVDSNHIQAIQQDLLERLCVVQRQKICEEVSVVSSLASRKKM